MLRTLYTLALFLVALAQPVHAVTVSGTHVTDDGKLVNLSGLEWLSWDETEGFSRDAIESGAGNTFIADGWRYATRSEFEALLAARVLAGSDIVKVVTSSEYRAREADVVREVGLFAERSDISEEIVRLQSHLSQFEGMIE